MIAIELAGLEKVIEETIAVCIFVAGDEAYYLGIVLNGELNEFALAEEAVHARVIWVIGGCLGGREHPS